MRRVAVTGLGLLTSAGLGHEALWQRLLAGEACFSRPEFAPEGSGLLLGAFPPFDPRPMIARKSIRTLDRVTLHVLTAATLAVNDAGLDWTRENRERGGVVMGSAYGAMTSTVLWNEGLLLRGPRRLNPADFPNTVHNSPPSQMSIEFALQALSSTITTGVGSTSGMDALGYAADCIRFGRADYILAGGFDEVYPKIFEAYDYLGLLAKRDGEVVGPRPFDRRHGGLVLGEGVAVCVVEDLEYAQRRGARIYAEIGGYGTFTGPARGARSKGGYRRSLSWAMALAMEAAGVTGPDIDFVAAEGDGTALGDTREAACLREVLGERAAAVPVFSFKGTTGYCLGANGALGAACAALALSSGVVPPTAGFSEPDPGCRLCVVAGEPRRVGGEVALVNATGPVTASSLVLKKYGA